jgi:hypothetical protein
MNNYSIKECFYKIQSNEQNALKEIRESFMMIRAELARKATISPFNNAFSNGLATPSQKGYGS